MSLRNFYESIPKNKQRQYYNPNSCDLVPIHPARILITGTSGNYNNKTGKTNVVLNIIEKCNNFERFYLFVKLLGDDPLYDDLLIPKLREIERRCKIPILIIESNTLDDLPSISDKEMIDPSYQNLI